MYWLELAGEDDPFAALEATAAAVDVTLRGPGVATASALDLDRVPDLALTHAAGELLGRTDASVASARRCLEAASVDRTGSVAVRAVDVRSTAGVDTQRAERELGQVLVDRGFAVDLDDPDQTLRALFAAGGLGRDRAAADVGSNDAEDAAGGALARPEDDVHEQSAAELHAQPSDDHHAQSADDPFAPTASDRLSVAPAVGTSSDEPSLARAREDDGDDADVCLLGWVDAERDAAFGDRRPTDRPFFQPGSMAPLLARALANLAGARPGATVVDPMCGTGGIALEAALVGARAVGVDAQAKMARGARENLAALAPPAGSPDDDAARSEADEAGRSADDATRSEADEAGRSADDATRSEADEAARSEADEAARAGAHSAGWDVVRGDARALPLADGTADGLVVDVPYERQSAVAADDLETLVTGALADARRVADRAVVVADRSWVAAARDAGWTVECVHRRRVHRSLVRSIHVLRSGPPDCESPSSGQVSPERQRL